MTKAKTRAASPARKAKARPVNPAEPEPNSPAWFASAVTTADRLVRIRALAERINGYIRFMGRVGKMDGVSDEAKDRAVALFYGRLLLLEQELGQIQENLQLD